VQVLKVQKEEGRAGGAANVARNLVALGGKSGVSGVLGKDDAGKELLSLLREDRIQVTGMVSVAKRPTSVKTRMIAHNQQMLRLDHETTEAVSKETEDRLIKSFEKAAQSYDLVVVSDYEKGTLTPKVVKKLIGAFRRAKKPVLVGLKGRGYLKYRGATGASLNRSELIHLSGVDDVRTGAKKLIRDLRLKFILVTMGAKGMLLVRSDGRSFSLPATARQVYDVTGAGDTVLATFALAYAENLSVEECSVLANAAAAIVVGKVGTETVSRSELIGGPKFRSEKIIESESVQDVFERERAVGRKVVFTNGVYDLFHTGHLS
ncbi:MAG: bifunctional ADP-heptose synthase, partial [Planctomycetota bacterium]|nr:bifunctional ADP-heptose synthase [Planctomycetota bacterium]